MRLDTGDNVIQIGEIIEAILKDTSDSGVSMHRPPIIAKPISVDAICSLSALSTTPRVVPSSNASGPIANVAFQLICYRSCHLHDVTMPRALSYGAYLKEAMCKENDVSECLSPISPPPGKFPGEYSPRLLFPVYELRGFSLP